MLKLNFDYLFLTYFEKVDLEMEIVLNESRRTM